MIVDDDQSGVTEPVRIDALVFGTGCDYMYSSVTEWITEQESCVLVGGR